MLLTGSGDELAYFRQWLITCLLSSLLPFMPLFTESSHGDQLLAPPIFSGVLRASCTFCCMFLFSSLFIIQFFFFFCWSVGQSLQGLCCFIPGVAVGIPYVTYLLSIWSAECLPSYFGAGIWWRGSLPVFSVLHGVEKLCIGWGFRVSKF
jgi:hypothetical protein